MDLSFDKVDVIALMRRCDAAESEVERLCGSVAELEDEVRRLRAMNARYERVVEAAEDARNCPEAFMDDLHRALDSLDRL